VPALDRVRQVAVERIDGALVFSLLEAEAAAALRAALDQRPVAGSALVANLQGDVFEPDLAEAGRAAARFLIERGALSGTYVHRGARGWNERFRGFREAWGAGGRKESAIQLIDLSAGNEPDASGVVRSDAVILDQSELLAAALRVAPQLVSATTTVVGLGESSNAAAHTEQTIIQYGGEEIGRRAAHAVLRRIEQGREDPPQFVRVAPRVVELEPVAAGVRR